MIKLTRTTGPTILSDIEVLSRAARFEATGENVWNDEDIKSALLRMSHNKCAYCECDVSVESKYLEVEHFKYKDKYKSDVALWDNLLPSCKRCNGTKGDHDVCAEPIINPCLDNPCDHLEFFLYRLRPKTAIGKTSEITLGLNHPIRAVKARFDIGEQILLSINSAVEKLEWFYENPSNLRRRKMLECVEGVLLECVPTVPYAATAASVLHISSEYHQLRNNLMKSGYWSPHLQGLHDLSLTIKL